MPTKKGEQWYADWIVAADVCMDLPGSFQKNKNEVLLRLDKLLLQQGILTYHLPYNLRLNFFSPHLLDKLNAKRGYLTWIFRLYQTYAYVILRKTYV